MRGFPNQYETFYKRCESSSTSDFKEYINMTESYTGNFSQIPSNPYGGTPIDSALTLMKDNKYYKLDNDEYAATRGNAVVVITDAEFNSNSGTNLSDTVSATSALAATGVRVFYMGFSSVNPGNMQQLAQAGGESSWYPITDADTIILNTLSVRKRVRSMPTALAF